jgi:hypothetical protein
MPDNRFLRYKPAHFSAFRFWVFRSIQSYDMRGKKPEKSRKKEPRPWPGFFLDETTRVPPHSARFSTPS